MINTYNESSLHKTIKLLYALNFDGKTEVNEDGHIYDILCKDNTVIEIQTKNLSKLLPKIFDALKKGRKVKVVHTVVISKIIELKDKNGKIISKRKSPKKGSIYDLFDELTGIYPVLSEKNFSLDVLEVNVCEQRIQTEEFVQSKNKKRRFLKKWIKTGKTLQEIICTRTFEKKQDYLNLLPEIPQIFCAKDLKDCLEKKHSKKIAQKSHLIIWVLHHANFLEFVKKENRTNFYKISE